MHYTVREDRAADADLQPLSRSSKHALDITCIMLVPAPNQYIAPLQHRYYSDIIVDRDCLLLQILASSTVQATHTVLAAAAWKQAPAAVHTAAQHRSFLADAPWQRHLALLDFSFHTPSPIPATDACARALLRRTRFPAAVHLKRPAPRSISPPPSPIRTVPNHTPRRALLCPAADVLSSRGPGCSFRFAALASSRTDGTPVPSSILLQLPQMCDELQLCCASGCSADV
ncbi:hypothetical protein PYCCODRAFT_451236 [Trametes coccinea BRFM310]|uniref:Uncharacterized protein n=1 Tax=Trametes coccinea (strain BRFM310) TaxID=1353009 RepID=A0A1Y2IPF6_TRAC3|nr:hypothetical protein PYCCODRAFT_451236 [Trametes coccinea BRFM310]